MELIQSRHNDLLSRFRKLYQSRSLREEQNVFLCEGEKMLREAAVSGCVETVLVREDLAAKTDLSRIRAQRISAVTEKAMEGLSDVKTPQGIIFTCRRVEKKFPEAPDKVLILDGLQDPGNLGTILRTAAAFSLSGLILTNDCVDRYNPKTVRATMGAIFKVPVLTLNREEILTACSDYHLKIYRADLHGSPKDLRNVPLKNCAVIIGNEGNGISSFFQNQVPDCFIIPMEEGNESLNASAAASIIAWEMIR